MASDLIYHNSRISAYRTPFGAVCCGSNVTLGINAPGAESVYLRFWQGDETLLPMHNDGRLWSVTFTCNTTGLLYYTFIINNGDGTTCYYCAPQDGLGGEGELLLYHDTLRSYQITVYYADLTVPEWCKAGVMYQIFPDRFAKDRDFTAKWGTKKHENWDEPISFVPDETGDYPADDFYGGTLKGIENGLDRLREMGVNVIYLNPVFSAYSNHRYDTADYETVDELLGTNEDFSSLCAAAKQKGIRIILDGVFSHTGSDSRYFNKKGRFDEPGAFQSTQSRWYSWYSFTDWPQKYASWWGVRTLPEANETCPSYLDYIVRDENSIVKRWLKAGASGWRLDVADELPDEFLFALRAAVKQVDKDALVLGEVWEDASRKESYGKMRPYLLGKQLDSVMNYPLRNAVIAYLYDKNAAMLVRRVLALQENYPHDIFYSLMNFLSSHDTMRILSVLGGMPQGLTREQQAVYRLDSEQLMIGKALVRLAYGIIFMLPGMPCIFYGDEAELEGGEDPFNRAAMPQVISNATNSWLCALCRLRRNEVLQQGSLVMRAAGELLLISRQYGGKTVTAVFNPTDYECEQLLDGTACPPSGLALASCAGTVTSVRENGQYLLLPPLGCAILQSK